MLKKIKENKPMAVMLVLFAVYAVFHAMFLQLSGDDVIWEYVAEFQNLFSANSENSRYFTNFLTYFMARIPLVRILIMIPFTLAFPFVFGKAAGNEKKTAAALIMGIFIWFNVPTEIVHHTTNWLSGFTNYIIGTILSLAAIWMFRPMLDGKGSKSSAKTAAFALILGFFGSLCIENLTIFNAALGIFMIIFTKIKYKKINPTAVFYTASTLVGAALIAFNGTYNSIFKGEADNFGDRYIELGFADVLTKLHLTIMPDFAHKYTTIHIITALSILILYAQKVKSTGKHPKYGKLMAFFVIIYAAYAFGARYFSEFISLTPAYRMDAILTALVFMYLIGLLYLFYHISPSDFPRRCVMIAGLVLVTAPFIVANPVNPRCFFSTYVFWGVIAADALISMLSSVRLGEMKVIRTAGAFFVSGICSMNIIMCITNQYVENLRVKYIKEQLADGKKTIEYIMLPYPNYTLDGMIIITAKQMEEDDNSLKTFGDNMDKDTLKLYSEKTCDHYGFDYSVLDKRFIEISTIDYYT